MNSNLDGLNGLQYKQNAIGANEVIGEKKLRSMLTHFTMDRRAIQLTKGKKGKGYQAKGQASKEVERLITRLQRDEQRALKVFIEAGESEDKEQYL